MNGRLGMMDLVEKEILEQIGTTGKGTYYILRGQRVHKGDIKNEARGIQTARNNSFIPVNKLMKQILQYLKTGLTEVAEVPAPGAGRGQLLIRTTRSLISAGTERKLVDFGKMRGLQNATC